MRTMASMIRLVPGDIVYVVLSPKTMVVLKTEVEKVEMCKTEISYVFKEGKIVCAKHSDEFKVGQRVCVVNKFYNSNLDTGVGLGEKKALFAFTSKDKCIDFLRSYNSYGK